MPNTYSLTNRCFIDLWWYHTGLNIGWHTSKYSGLIRLRWIQFINMFVCFLKNKKKQPQFCGSVSHYQLYYIILHVSTQGLDVVLRLWTSKYHDITQVLLFPAFKAEWQYNCAIFCTEHTVLAIILCAFTYLAIITEDYLSKVSLCKYFAKATLAISTVSRYVIKKCCEI